MEWNGMEGNIHTSATRRRKSGDGVADEPTGFQSFWREWPKHDRKVDRAGCLRHWKRAKLEPIAEQVMAGLRRWKASEDWAKGYLPLVLTWLHQGRWQAPEGEAALWTGKDEPGRRDPTPDEIEEINREDQE